jgi:glycosyl transferase family 25
VISLARTPERWELFQKANRHLANVERVEAIDGKLCSRAKLAIDGYIAPDLKYTAGAIGCAMSHVRQWERCVEADEPLLVLEDDAITRGNIEKVLELIFGSSGETRGYDYVALGWNFDCPAQLDLLPGVTPAQITLKPDELAKNAQKFQQETRIPTFYPLQWCFGTPGYIISPEGARTLLSQLLPLRNFTMTTNLGTAENTGIDVALNAVYSKLRAYASLPPLVITPNDKATSTVFQAAVEKAVA